MAQVVALQHLFGASSPWSADDWTASDDRVRGGKSQSHFSVGHGLGQFYGDLDIDTLGGAGFASQRTSADSTVWDLARFDGIQLVVAKADGKRYTLIIKDTLLSPNPSNGREQATTSYEYDFKTDDTGSPQTICIPWSEFKPTYRGREQKDASPLDTSRIRRLSIMMRSFFGTQQGAFSLSLRSISAYTATNYGSKHDLEDPRTIESAPVAGPDGTAPRAGSPRDALILCCAAVLTVCALYTVYHRLTRAL